MEEVFKKITFLNLPAGNEGGNGAVTCAGFPEPR